MACQVEKHIGNTALLRAAAVHVAASGPNLKAAARMQVLSSLKP